MKFHLSIATVFCFKLVASLHQDATSHLRTALDMPVEAKHMEVHDHRDLASGALTGLVLYDTSTKTNITLTNNLTIVSADPKYTVVALLSGTVGIESVRFQAQAGKSTVYTKIENNFLYTLCGNNGNNLTTCTFLKYGTYTVRATAFAKDNAKGVQVGSAITITFAIAPPPPTKAPTKVPTKVPTKHPTKRPTKHPTKCPTKQPTKRPTEQPSKPPTKRPTKQPTEAPIKPPCPNNDYTKYINSVTLSKTTLSSSGNKPLEQALGQLIISSDNPQGDLSICLEEDRKRLNQRFAYLAFMFSTNGKNSPSWFSNPNECSWTGITCTGTTVTELDLSSTGLAGTIPDDVGLWTGLTFFGVNINQLVGSLPTSIGLWSSLTTFAVHNNKLTGTVPKQVANWAYINIALFHKNMLNGAMPAFGNKFCPKDGIGGALWVDCADIQCSCCNLCFSGRL
jgi:PT repeat/Leucine rich repeat N-terminal domain